MCNYINIYSALVGDYTNVILNRIYSNGMQRHGMDSFGTRCGLVAGRCEHMNEHPVCIAFGEGIVSFSARILIYRLNYAETTERK
jgi:hypothetical protein